MPTSVLFDISHKGYNWLPIFFGIIFTGVGFLGWKYPFLRRVFHIPPIIVIVLGITIGIGAFLFQWSNRNSYERILEQQQALIVQGPIENFQPMPYAGHADETFTVQGVPFAYSDFGITPAFNNTSSHGGPLHGGLLVKIYYTNSREFTGQYAILRIEANP